MITGLYFLQVFINTDVFASSDTDLQASAIATNQRRAIEAIESGSTPELPPVPP